MRLKETMIAWTPDREWHSDSQTRGMVKCGPHPDKTGWSDDYAFTDGACWVSQKDGWRAMPEWQRIAMLFIIFNQMVVRDGVNPLVAHKALLEIDEYAEKIPPDQDGARHPHS